MSQIITHVGFVNLLLHVYQTVIEQMNPDDFFELYSSNRINLRIVKHLCENEMSNVSDLQYICRDIRSLSTSSVDQQRATNQNFFQRIHPNSEENVMKMLDRGFDREFHLFLWCLLYQHFDLARFFWHRCQFPIANGLIANSILHSIARLRITHSETTDKCKEEAIQYERCASFK